ncbi:MAG: pyrroline-5-carboxylate reductase [Gemmataceae bacterium]
MSTPTPRPHAIGFLGAGQMATALYRAWSAGGHLDSLSTWASDPYPSARDRFAKATGGLVTETNSTVVTTTQILILAVKPQMLPGLLAEIRPLVRPEQLVISIAAGVTLAQLAEGLPERTRLARVMPNTPCLVQAAASGFTMGPHTTIDDEQTVTQLMNAVGRAFAVAEPLLDAVTGLSGSGPAFVYMMIEAMADGGVRMGLPRDVAQMLAAQTVLGSAKMVLETGQHPGALKDVVASPGGTTIAGIHALERAGMRAAFMDAIEAATRRATELGSTR